MVSREEGVAPAKFTAAPAYLDQPSPYTVVVFNVGSRMKVLKCAVCSQHNVPTRAFFLKKNPATC